MPGGIGGSSKGRMRATAMRTLEKRGDMEAAVFGGTSTNTERGHRQSM